MELKMLHHTRKTCSWSVTPKVKNVALIWTLTPANNKMSLYMQNVTIKY